MPFNPITGPSGLINTTRSIKSSMKLSNTREDGLRPVLVTSSSDLVLPDRLDASANGRYFS